MSVGWWAGGFGAEETVFTGCQRGDGTGVCQPPAEAEPPAQGGGDEELLAVRLHHLG